MTRVQSLRTGALAALVFALGAVECAQAAFVPVASGNNLPDTDGSSANAKYKVTYGSGSVTYDSADVTDGSAVQHGTIKITDTFTTCDAHEITFMQTETPNGGFTASGGLRLQVELMITNQSGALWQSFWIKTSDTVPTNTTTVSSGHRHEAHFHPNDGAPGPPAVSGTTGFTTLSVPNNEQMAEVGGGISAPGQTFNTVGFFLHERNLQNGTENLTRTFTLILMPHCVPELSSCLTWALTILAVSGAGYSRRGIGRPKETLS